MIINKKIKRRKKIILRRSKFGSKVTHELLIHKTNKNIYAYVSNLSTFSVIATVSSLSLKDDERKGLSGTEIAAKVGQMAVDKCKKLSLKPITEVSVNIAECKYIGRVKALVDNFVK